MPAVTVVLFSTQIALLRAHLDTRVPRIYPVSKEPGMLAQSDPVTRPAGLPARCQGPRRRPPRRAAGRPGGRPDLIIMRMMSIMCNGQQ